MEKILIVTGEASGDLHGALLIKELKKLIPDLKIFGIGGEKLKEEGVELIYHIRDIAVVGILEVIPKFFRIRNAMSVLYQKMLSDRPDVCLLIDYPGFNLRFARLAKKKGIKVVYYILPQIWAWGRWRVKSIYRWIDKGISILPFEQEFYDVSRFIGTQIEFVGHPLLDIIQPKTENRKPKTEIIALLPGSRKEEIKRILPVMLECVKEMPEFEFILPVAPGIDRNCIERLVVATNELPLHRIKIVEGSVYEILRSSKLALIASGTATLEACILEVPMIIIYKFGLISYIFGRLLVRTRWIGLPNIIAGEEVVPEFIQFNTKPPKIIKTARRILKNREQTVLKLREVNKKLGSSGAAHRAAEILYKFTSKATD